MSLLKSSSLSRFTGATSSSASLVCRTVMYNGGRAKTMRSTSHYYISDSAVMGQNLILNMVSNPFYRGVGLILSD